MVFQSNTLYPSLNVYDNMAFGLRLRKSPEALVQERVKVVANMLGLNDILYKKPKVLTAAMKQRVSVARAIVREPRLYLFDDPLSGLDEKLRSDMLNVILNVQARLQGTFVYATKNLPEALTIGTRLVVMKDGFVKQIDTPKNLYKYPANKFVAGFIGTPQMNFFNAVLLKNGKNVNISFTEGESELSIPAVKFARVQPKYLNGKSPLSAAFVRLCDYLCVDPQDILKEAKEDLTEESYVQTSN